MSTFIDLCVSGQEDISNVDRYIRMWHASKRRIRLRELLGLTYEEYGQWIAEETTLQKIVEKRREE